jgi:hypothetical protein
MEKCCGLKAGEYRLCDGMSNGCGKREDATDIAAEGMRALGLNRMIKQTKQKWRNKTSEIAIPMMMNNRWIRKCARRSGARRIFSFTTV